MKCTKILLAVAMVVCSGISADQAADNKCGCNANKPQVKPRPGQAREMPKPAPQKNAAAQPQDKPAAAPAA